MTTTSATQSIVAALGGGSGVDFAALATNLAEAQFAARKDRVASRSELVERQVSAASQLRSQITQLATSVGDRVRSGDISTQPQIANGAVATVSRGAASGSGTYSLEVTALARGQVLASPTLPAGTAPGSGTLTIRFGTLDGTFAEDPARSPLALTIAPGTTLAGIAGQINAARAGISAYVAQGPGGAQLVLKGSEGAPNGFMVEATEDMAQPGLAALAWAPGSDPARLTAQAADAAFRLDGVALTARSNTIENVAPGLSLQLTGTNPGAPTTIRFSQPNTAVSGFMQDFASALNELASSLGELTNPQGGDLARDPGARALRQALTGLGSAVILPNAAPGQPRTLAELGLATNRDGTFRLDAGRLEAALKAAPEGVAAMFTTGIHGVYATLDRLARNAGAVGNPGSLGGSVSRYNALKTRLTEEATELADAQAALRAQLAKRFAAADSRVGASRGTLSFLQNQIDAWNAQRN